MQQTEKYQFNLIEGSDPFLPGALNENAVKAEQALEENRAEASGALAALTADTAARFAALTKIHIMTWTGDGQSTRTITFPFKPKVVIASPAYLAPGTEAFIYGQTDALRISSAGSYQQITLKWEENSLTFGRYSSSNDFSYMFNANGKEYFAVLLG